MAPRSRCAISRSSATRFAARCRMSAAWSSAIASRDSRSRATNRYRTSVTERSSATVNSLVWASSIALRARRFTSCSEAAPVWAMFAAVRSESADRACLDQVTPSDILRVFGGAALPSGTARAQGALPYVVERVFPQIGGPIPLRGCIDQMFNIPIGDLRQRRQFEFVHCGYSANAAVAELSESVYARAAVVSEAPTDQMRSACAADAASTRA